MIRRRGSGRVLCGHPRVGAVDPAVSLDGLRGDLLGVVLCHRAFEIGDSVSDHLHADGACRVNAIHDFHAWYRWNEKSRGDGALQFGREVDCGTRVEIRDLEDLRAACHAVLEGVEIGNGVRADDGNLLRDAWGDDDRDLWPADADGCRVDRWSGSCVDDDRHRCVGCGLRPAFRDAGESRPR